MNNLPLEMTLQVFSAPLTDLGKKRSNNEDWVAGFEPADLEEIRHSGNLYIVADGVGGASKGERASKYAAQKVLYEYYRQPHVPPAERLEMLIRSACRDIYQYSIDNGLSRMATTLVAAVIRGDRLTIANVGDSRGYLIRAGQISQITRDHNLADELVRNGSITSEEAKFSKTRNKLMRSLGGESDVDVDIFSDIQLYPGDLILLCTDGLTRYATEADLIRLSADGTPEEIARKMIDFANQAGGADNITLYLIEICAPGEKKFTVSRGRAPEPVDWDTIQTQYGVHKLQRKKEFPFKTLLIYGLLGFIVMMIIILGIIIGLNITRTGVSTLLSSPSQTTAPVTPVIATASLPVATLSADLPITQVTPDKTNIPDLPIEPTITPAVISTLPGVPACVHPIVSGENASELFQKFELVVTDNDTVDVIDNCDIPKEQCSGNFSRVGAGTITPGYYLKIPVETQSSCEIDPDSFFWVIIFDET